MKLDEILNILFANHENPHAVVLFFNCIKMQIKFENHEIHRGLMVSYVKLVINHIECFEQIVIDGA
jgi:hypothetical protein